MISPTMGYIYLACDRCPGHGLFPSQLSHMVGWFCTMKNVLNESAIDIPCPPLVILRVSTRHSNKYLLVHTKLSIRNDNCAECLTSLYLRSLDLVHLKPKGLVYLVLCPRASVIVSCDFPEAPAPVLFVTCRMTRLYVVKLGTPLSLTSSNK